MNVETGEIREFGPNEQIPPRFIALTNREAAHLRGRKQKDRIAELKRMRKQAIRTAKLAKGERLTTEEVKTSLAGLK